MNRWLRLVGGSLVVLGVLSLWAVPFASMHVREAEESLTGTLHLVGGAIVLPLLLVVVVFAVALVRRHLAAVADRGEEVPTNAIPLAFTREEREAR